MIDVTLPSQQTPNADTTRIIQRRRFRLATLAALPALLLGCAIPDETMPGASGDTSGGMPVACPRDPDISMATAAVFTEDEQTRQNEVCQRVVEQYKQLGYVITFTSQGPTGTTYDWVDATTVEGSDAEPPPTLTQEEIQSQLPEGVGLQLTEIDVNPELRGPDGTIPFTRPTFSAYVAGGTGATSLDDWITNYQVVGPPPSAKEQHRMYAGMLTFAPNQGASVWINSYGGLIEPDTMSLLEMAVGCRDPKNPITGEIRQMIGIAASRDNMNLNGRFFGHPADSVLRLQVEFLTEGSGVTGPQERRLG